MRLYTENIDVSYSRRLIVENLHLEIPTGKITVLIGANGSGKSTILKTMCRILSPDRGRVMLDGVSVHTMNTKDLARRLAILPQNPESPEGLTVGELVGYGRAPYKSGYGRLNKEDKEKINWALEVTQMTEFAERPLEHLSGGQRQRAWIAMCIAQDTEIVFLDEPTTFLDVAYQLEVLMLLRELNEKYGKTIIMVIHDLNQASRFADHVVAIKNGKIVCTGSPEKVLTAETCKEVFGVCVDIIMCGRTNKPLCIPFDIEKENI